MNYYYPDNKQSKAFWVFDAMSHLKLKNNSSVFWGLAGRNFNEIKRHQEQKIPFYFTDMPYWHRWMGDNRNSCSWRIIPNALHCNWQQDYPSDRFKKLNVTIKDWRNKGDHILVCPSSVTMNRFYDQNNWLNDTINELKQNTDRPIKIRNKPRAKNSSGPRVAEIPFEDDVKNAWAVVTLSSISGVEAACLGIPVFSHKVGPCSVLGNLDLKNIESPKLMNREMWLNTLAYYQYTEKEIKDGVCKHLNDIILS